MKYMQKKALPLWGMVSLALLLNVLIIIAANQNQSLLWLLVVSILLFLIATYFAWKTGHLIQKYSGDRPQPSAQHTHFKWLSHSVYPTKITSTDLKVQIGNDQCSQPYNACILNVGSIENVTEEGVFSDAPQKNGLEYPGYLVDETLEIYHLTEGGFIWQIGPGYIGCRTEDGYFSSEVFKKVACRPEVKMIELKLSSVNNTSYPADSCMRFIDKIDSKMDGAIFSDPAFTTFSDAEGMIHFLNDLRELSGGKPIGLRICINKKKELYQICYAIKKTQLIPDFFFVEGSPESTGILHSDKAIHDRMPLYKALLFVSQTLQMYGLENKIKIISDGRVISGFDILKVLALGADVICTEIPRYQIIRYPGNGQNMALQVMRQNVNDLYDNLMKDTVQIMRMCGFKGVSDINLSNFFGSLDLIHSKNFEELQDSILYTESVKKGYSLN